MPHDYVVGANWNPIVILACSTKGWLDSNTSTYLRSKGKILPMLCKGETLVSVLKELLVCTVPYLLRKVLALQVASCIL